MPVHPRGRLKRKRKIKLENYDNLTKKSKGSDVTFMKQMPLHPRERLQRLSKVDDKLHSVREVASVKPKHTLKTKSKIEKMKLTNDQIEAINNSSMLMDGEFNFSRQKILNKRSIFDISMVDEETIIDKIIEGLDDT